MKAQEAKLQAIDEEKIRSAVHLHTPIEITTYTLPHNMELYIQEVLSVFLTECHQEHMIEYLKFCLSELLTNSKKANTKRIYFKQQHLDLNNELDYHSGMVSFKDDTLDNIQWYLEEQKKAGLYVKLNLQVTDDSIIFQIRNNCLLTVFESKRINEKLKTAQKYGNVDEVLTKVIDQTEGAGLGIIIIILMLQKIGLSQDNYKVFCTDKETVTSIVLPQNQEYLGKLEKLCDEYIKTQKAIPVIEENLTQLKELLNAGAGQEELFNFIKKDVTLSFALIKHAALKDKNCMSLVKALELVPIEELKTIFTETNSEFRLVKKADDKRELWEHAYKVAVYAYNIAYNLLKDKEVDLEKIYTLGLFHDIACLLLEVSDTEQKAKIDEIIKENGVPEYSVEMFYNDNRHNYEGADFARAQSMPEELCNLIQYHNIPEKAPDDIKYMIYALYLADMVQYYNSKQLEYYQFNKEILKELNIESEEQLKFIISKVESLF